MVDSGRVHTKVHLFSTKVQRINSTYLNGFDAAVCLYCAEIFFSGLVAVQEDGISVLDGL